MLHLFIIQKPLTFLRAESQVLCDIQIIPFIINIRITVVIQNRNRSSMDSIQTKKSAQITLLKNKKKEMIGKESFTRARIKEYFTEFTIAVQGLEDRLMTDYEAKICEFYQSVDEFCYMEEPDRQYFDADVCNLLQTQIQFCINKEVDRIVQDSLRTSAANCQLASIGCPLPEEDEHSINVYSLIDPHSLYLQTTNKKQKFAHQNGSQAAQEAILKKYEQKIESLLIKQEKMKKKLADAEARLKMKKVGGCLLPVEPPAANDKNLSWIRLQRLQSQNKILVEQISDCSQKIIALSSNISSESVITNVLNTTQKKKPTQDQSDQNQHSELKEQKVHLLEQRLAMLQEQLAQQTQHHIQKQQQILRQHEKVCEEFNTKIRELSDYNSRLYNQCETNISKKVQLQEKVQEIEKQKIKIVQQIAALTEKCNNYHQVFQLKNLRLSELESTVESMMKSQQEIAEKCQLLSAQLLNEKQMQTAMINSKQLEQDSLKSCIKKQQVEKSKLQEILSKREEQIYTMKEELDAKSRELAKAIKQKEGYAKKQCAKVKKQLKMVHEEDKKRMGEEFGAKHGNLLEKIELLSRDLMDVIERYEGKHKIVENRMDILKNKVAYEVKEMLEKAQRSTNKESKQRLHEIIETYIESQSAMALKNSVNKQLKEQIALIKKGMKAPKASLTSVTEYNVSGEINQLQKKIWQQKMAIQSSLYEQRIKGLQQMHQFQLLQKKQQIQVLKAKNESLRKNVKELKENTNSSEPQASIDAEKMKQKLEKCLQKEKKMQSLASGLKNSTTKYQNETLQLKEELKVKKELVSGLKKELKQKECEKSKLIETVDGLMEENERLKRGLKEAGKKQAIYEEIKEKIQYYKQLEIQVQDLKKQLEEKQRNLKIEISKKQSAIKQWKTIEEKETKKMKSVSELEEEILDLKQKIRKLKSEVERKDTYIQHMKSKSEKAEAELEGNNEKLTGELKRIMKDLEAERLKFDALKISNSKLCSNLKLLKIVLIKVHEKIGEQMKKQALKQKSNIKSYDSKYEFTTEKTPGRADIKTYNQGLSILGLSCDDMHAGWSTNLQTVSACSPIQNKINFEVQDKTDSTKLIEKLEQTEIDSKMLLEQFDKLMQITD